MLRQGRFEALAQGFFCCRRPPGPAAVLVLAESGAMMQPSATSDTEPKPLLLASQAAAAISTVPKPVLRPPSVA